MVKYDNLENSKASLESQDHTAGVRSPNDKVDMDIVTDRISWNAYIPLF